VPLLLAVRMERRGSHSATTAYQSFVGARMQAAATLGSRGRKKIVRFGRYDYQSAIKQGEVVW